jgi:hypothetical protein
MKNLKLILAMLFGVTLAVPAVFAADHEESETTDTSKNPFTGTVTETKEYKKTDKNADGSSAKYHVTNKKKTKSDGSVKKNTEVETTTEH